MVMERRRHMIDLFEASQKYGVFSESFCRSVLRQVVKATQHCIKVGILHRDIKDENVLVDLKTGEVSSDAETYQTSPYLMPSRPYECFSVCRHELSDSSIRLRL